MTKPSVCSLPRDTGLTLLNPEIQVVFAGHFEN